MASESDYLTQLKAEKAGLNPTFVHVSRLLSEEIDRVEKGTKYTTLHNEFKVKLQEKVVLPVKEHPKVNFVGKLLGPGGQSLKRLQQETGSKMSILGKGSIRDKAKVAELLKSDPEKYGHLNEDLHVMVEILAPAVEAHMRMSHALAEVSKYMHPDYTDDIQQQQMMEMGYSNGADEGKPHPPPPMGMVRGRGGPRGRGMPPPMRGRGGSAVGGAGLLATPVVPSGGRGGRGMRGGPSMRGAPPMRGAPSMRGGPASRGVPPGRGMRPAPRGSRGGMAPPRQPPPVQVQPVYEEDYSSQATYADDGYGGYAEQAFDEQPIYEQDYGTETQDNQYYDYGEAQVEQSYETSYDDSWSSAATAYKAQSSRSKPSDYRSHPYSNNSRGSSNQRY